MDTEVRVGEQAELNMDVHAQLADTIEFMKNTERTLSTLLKNDNFLLKKYN
jgi:hypothetical protein